MTFQDYWLILRRRRLIILQVFLFFVVAGLLAGYLTPPAFQASAELLVDTPAASVSTMDSGNPLSALFMPTQEQNVDTLVQVLQASPLLDQVKKQVGPATITVTNAKDTNVIVVTAEARTSSQAASAANTLINLYLQGDLDQNINGIQDARLFISQQAAQAHGHLDKAETALRDFKQQHGITDLLQNRDAQAVRVASLTEHSSQEQSSLSALSAQIAADKILLAQQPASILVNLQATNFLRGKLQTEIGELYVKRQSITQKGGFTTDAPQVQSLDGSILELRRQLAEQPTLEVSKSSSPNVIKEQLQGQIVSLEAQAASTRVVASAAKQELAHAQAQVALFAGWELQIGRLTRDRDLTAASYRNLTDELAQLTLREKVQRVGAHIIQSAQPPPFPVRPKKMQYLLFACVLGLFVGVCLAVLLEHLDDRINTVDEAERALGLASLGQVPVLAKGAPRLLFEMRGSDSTLESYRILRSNIYFTQIDAPLRTLVITSPGMGEGKTTTAANLAIAMALDGKNVILVDADLRRPTLHRLIDLPPAPGLTDVLLGKAKLSNVLLDHESVPGLAALASGSTPPNPAELLNSRSFRNLVEQLIGMSDIVIFDSPPVFAGADAQILASQMDGTVLIVEAGETKKKAARYAISRLQQARATLLGIIHNKVSSLDAYGHYHFIYPRLTDQSQVNHSETRRIGTTETNIAKKDETP